MPHFKAIIALISLLMTCACTHQIYVKSLTPLKQVKLGDHEVSTVDEGGRFFRAPTGLGSLPFEGQKPDGEKITGVIERNEINVEAVVLSVAGTLVAMPAMLILGALIANPEWALLSAVNARANVGSASVSYMHQTMSPWTIPVSAIFALVGTTPLLGLLRSEKVSDEVIYLR